MLVGGEVLASDRAEGTVPADELSATRIDVARDIEIMNPADIPGGSNNVLRRKGYAEARAIDELFVRLPEQEEVRRLRLRPGTPVTIRRARPEEVRAVADLWTAAAARLHAMGTTSGSTPCVPTPRPPARPGCAWTPGPPTPACTATTSAAASNPSARCTAPASSPARSSNARHHGAQPGRRRH
jgi:hypothetical protein